MDGGRQEAEGLGVGRVSARARRWTAVDVEADTEDKSLGAE